MAERRSFIKTVRPGTLIYRFDKTVTFCANVSEPGLLSSTAMSGPGSEKWVELCEQAGNERDSGRMLELVRQINDLLEQKRSCIAFGTRAADERGETRVPSSG